MGGDLRWSDVRWDDVPLVAAARDQVLGRVREREARRAQVRYEAALARRERARRRPRRQLWSRLGLAGALAGGAALPVTVAPLDPVLFVASGAALAAAAVLPRRAPADRELPPVPLPPVPLLPAGSQADTLVRRAHGAADALRAMAASSPSAVHDSVAAAAAEAEAWLPECYALAQRAAAVQAGRSRVADPSTAAALDSAAGALLGRLGGAVLAAERLCSSAAGALGAEAEHWSFEVERLEAATRDLGAVADALRETAASETRHGLR